MRPGLRSGFIEAFRGKVRQGCSRRCAKASFRILFGAEQDITVDGVSLVLTYRSEFDQITGVSGIDGLIKRLKEKNA